MTSSSQHDLFLIRFPYLQGVTNPPTSFLFLYIEKRNSGKDDKEERVEIIRFRIFFPTSVSPPFIVRENKKSELTSVCMENYWLFPQTLHLKKELLMQEL